MIPKIVHQTWKNEQIPEKWKESHDSWKSLARYGWEYKLWTDELMRQFIAEHYDWFLAQYDSYPQNINRVDAWRYFVLHHYGGLYTDLDNVCKPKSFLTFYELIKNEDVALPKVKQGNGNKEHNVTNCFIASTVGSNFWPHVWRMLQNPYKHYPYKSTVGSMSKYFNVIFTTGPSLLAESYNSYNAKDSVYLIPAEMCQPLDDSVPKPHDTRESIIKVIGGNSWHPKDAQFILFFRDLMRHSSVILGVFIAMCLCVIIGLSVTVAHSKRIQRSST